MAFISPSTRLPYTLCMPGYPPRHVYAATWRLLLTYLLTADAPLVLILCRSRSRLSYSRLSFGAVHKITVEQRAFASSQLPCPPPPRVKDACAH